MSTVNRIHLSSGIVYIAGVECPVESITVSGGEGIIPSMTLALPASIELVRFGEEDRVPVAAFYLDQWYSETGKPEGIVPTMRLLFDGEITDWSYMKTPGGDYINFSCTANVSMLNNMYANFLIGQDTPAQSIATENFNSSQGVVVGDFKTFPLILLNQGLFAGAARPLARPFDFISNMLLASKIGGYPNDKAIGTDGKYTKKFRDAIKDLDAQPRVTPGAYAEFLSGIVPAIMGFFVTYCQKTKFDRRWIATPLERFTQADDLTDIHDPDKYLQSVDPTFAAIRADIFYRAAQRSLESLFGQGDSFWKILNTYYALNSFQILMLPTAPYVVVERDSIENYGTGSSSYIPMSTATSGGTTQTRLGNYISKPISYFALPPECNILFPGLVSSISFQENYAAQATRTMAGNPFLDIAERQGTLPKSGDVAKSATVNAWPEALSNLVGLSGPKQFSTMLLYPEEFFKGPVVNNVTIPSWFTALKEAAKAQDTVSSTAKTQQNTQAANRKASSDATSLKSSVSSISALTPDAAAALGAQANRGVSLTDDQKIAIYSQYIRMSHFENRFSTRGGQVSCPFNPYILPCYPFVYLDKSDAAMHIVGCVTSFQHQLSAVSGLSTSFTYSHGRTLKETYEIAIATHLDKMSKDSAAFDKNPVFYSSAPLEPTTTVANMLQTDTGAAAYYKQTFYQNPEPSAQGTSEAPVKEYVFKYQTYFQNLVTDPYKKVKEPLPTSRPVLTTSLASVTLDLKTSSLDNLLDYSKGMIRVSRPICTLDQYIKFINNGSSDAAGPPIPAEVYGVSVPRVIRTYGFSTAGKSTPLDSYITPTSKVPTGDNAPQDMRRDWVSLIEEYSKKIYDRIIQ